MCIALVHSVTIQCTQHIRLRGEKTIKNVYITCESEKNRNKRRGWRKEATGNEWRHDDNDKCLTTPTLLFMNIKKNMYRTTTMWKCHFFHDCLIDSCQSDNSFLSPASSLLPMCEFFWLSACWKKIEFQRIESEAIKMMISSDEERKKTLATCTV